MSMYERILEQYGIDNQILQFFEELAELQVALAHFRRNRNNLQDLIEEFADVSIMTKQILGYYKIKYEDIEKVVEKKLRRMEDRLDEKKQP